MSALEEKSKTSTARNHHGAVGIPDVISEPDRLEFRHWLNRDMLAYLLLGVLTGLPTMVTTTGANAMFIGVTGAFGLCLSCTAALTSFLAPLVLHHLCCNMRMVIVMVSSVLAFVVCTLGTSPVGPAIGTVFAGFVYAFGTIFYLAVAAFYSRHTVVAFSIGSGLSCVIGPSLYIGFNKAFQGDWRKVLYVSIPFMILQPLTWWCLLSSDGRLAAENSRLVANHKAKTSNTTTAAEVETTGSDSGGIETGFGPGYKRFTLFWKTILPRYVLPLLFCTGGAIFVLFCLAPTYKFLNLFKKAPKGDLNYQINFLVYGCGQFLISVYSLFHKLPKIWLWAIVQVVILAIGITQLFEPFLKYYGAWMPFIFFAGGIVGGAVANTNYKIAKDFSDLGAAEEVRSFAMSYGGLGNFGGDAIGGGFAILVQQLAEAHIKVR